MSATPRRSPRATSTAKKKSPRKSPAALEVLAEGKHLRLVKRAGWEYAERTKVSGVVVIVARTDADELVLIEQLRPVIGERIIELPAGLAGDSASTSDEPLKNAVQRELFEETGYEAKRIELLTEGPSSAGLTNEILSFFLATGLTRTGDGGGDEAEDIQVHVVPLAETGAWLAAQHKRGKMIDPKVWAGLYFAGARHTPKPRASRRGPARPRR
ncbi:MAG TPA: NUDIX hydrolase [Planctomycetaceae bacterium]|nr:NUDIX hydrolase [Planctomycetaceae bacterium]